MRLEVARVLAAGGRVVAALAHARVEAEAALVQVGVRQGVVRCDALVLQGDT